MNRIIFVFGVLLIVSCEWEATENYIIDNQTKFNMSIDFIIINTGIDSTSQKSYSISVQPETKEFLYQDNTIVALLFEENEDFLRYFDTIIVAINDTLRISKDINNYMNWEYNRVNHRISADNCHIFAITESDIIQ
jgi:hypothetical protein